MRKKVLSLLLAMVMVVGMLPTIAIAAPAAASSVIFHTGTMAWRQITTLDRIEGDGPYAIVYYGTAAKSILYCHSESNKDQPIGTINQNTCSIVNGSDPAQLDSSKGIDGNGQTSWTITKTGNGYAIKSVGANRYLNIEGATANGSSVGLVPTTTDEVSLDIKEVAGGFTISKEIGGTTYYLCHNDSNDNTKKYFYVSTTTPTPAIRIFKYTDEIQCDTLAKAEFSGQSDEPMDLADIGASVSRIPGFTTLDNGWLVAASDVRWNSHEDNPENIDTIVSVSKDGGVTWDWEIINYMSDWAEGVKSYKSASFIDPAILSTGNTVWVVADITPYMNGGWGMDRAKLSNAGTGYDGDSDSMLVIYDANASTNPVTSPDSYNYRINLSDLNGTKYANDAWGRRRTVYPITAKAGYSDSENLADGMYVDAYFNLYETMENAIVPVYCQQLGSSSTYTQNNLFYSQSSWRIFPTFYLCMRKGRVSGDKLVWDDPIYPNVRYADQNRYFMAVCPGRGLVFDYEGTERLLFAVYDTNTGGEKASAIYSDNGGETWTRGTGYSGVTTSGESQVIQTPNGNLRMYSRNGSTTFVYSESSDGGDTWGAST